MFVHANKPLKNPSVILREAKNLFYLGNQKPFTADSSLRSE